jgi:Hypervirulence associated proteins TUDOR domain
MAVKKSKLLKPGTKVRWNTSQGPTTGKVVKKQTKATKIKTHTVAASKSDPEYIVKSDKSGAKAAHKRKALKRV